MTTTYETLALEEPAPHVALIRLNRPGASNAFNTRMGLDMLALFEGLAADPAAYRCLVLTGAGERAFCAGADLKERDGMTDAAWQAQHLVFERMTRAVLSCPVPLIGAVNGAAFGGGCELALCCDFIYASTTARFAQTEVVLGVMPGAGGTQTLPRAIGARRAKEVMLTGAPFSAQDAHDWGLVNRLCAPDRLLADALEAAGGIAANAPLATQRIKHAVDIGLQTDLTSGLMFEIEAYNRLVPTEDRREGVRAFNEKRKPLFRGC